MNENPSAPDADATPLPHTEDTALAVAGPVPHADPPPPGPSRRRGVAVVAGGLAAGVVVLLAAVIWLLSHPPGPPPEQQAAVDRLNREVETLTARLAAVEAKPAPAGPTPVNLAPLTARVGKLEQRPVTDPAALAALASRLDSLTGTVNKTAATIEATAGRADAAGTKADATASKMDAFAASLQSAQAALTTNVQATQTALTNQVGATTQHVEALADRVQAFDAGTTGRLDADEKRLAALEQATAQISALAARGARADRLTAAANALASGEKLGDIAGAPPALQRYATVAPPTEAGLRLSYPAAAHAAEAAEAPPSEGSSFAERVWSNVSQAVTIRQGEHVIIGGSAAPTLEKARELLDAGDLAGAVAALDGLSGPPAAAMAGWVAQAKNLLAARAALAAMTARS